MAAKKNGKELVKKLGTGAARKAGDAIINRKKQMEDAMKSAKKKSPKKKKSMYA
ncbi:hypothetical protein D3C87_1612080 [compost metagenome]